MKKSIVLLLSMAVLSAFVVTAANVRSDRVAPADDIVLNNDAADVDNDSQYSPLSYRVLNKEYVGWVIDFYNSGNRKITVKYCYHNGSKWVENTVSVSAGKWNRNNNAGPRGNVDRKSVSWHY